MKSFLKGFLSAFVLLVACAAAPVFPYKFYNLSGIPFTAGTLVGPAPQDDVPFSQCAPVPGHDAGGKPILIQQCVVVFYTELNALIKDYKQTKQDLITCQKGR